MIETNRTKQKLWQLLRLVREASAALLSLVLMLFHQISFHFSSCHFNWVENLFLLLPLWATKPKGIAQHFVSVIPDYLWAYDARLKPEYYQKPKIEAIYQPKTHTYQINHYSNLCYMIFHIFHGDICLVRFPDDKVLLIFFVICMSRHNMHK